MILYHGSYMVVKNPIIIPSHNGNDFGNAFYTTPIKKHAEKWAKKKAKYFKNSKCIVSIFEWDENSTNLNVKNFIDANEEWLNMVIKCRTILNYKHKYDIVIGKIADDTVGSTINLVLKGFMRKEDAIEKLKFKEINSQYAFCSETSLKELKFIDSYEVK